jgi:hypothetical protein
MLEKFMRTDAFIPLSSRFPALAYLKNLFNLLLEPTSIWLQMRELMITLMRMLLN